MLIKLAKRMSKQPLVSVLIVSHNGFSDVAGLLLSLYSQSFQNFEILIAENGSHSSYYALSRTISFRFHPTRVFFIENEGFAEANNYLATRAQGDLLLLINPDTKLENDTIGILLSSIQSNSECAAVCPLTLFFERYIRVAFRDVSGSTRYIDKQFLTQGLPCKKIIVRKGIDGDSCITLDPLSDSAIIDIPVNDDISSMIMRIAAPDGMSIRGEDLEVEICGQNIDTGLVFYGGYISIPISRDHIDDSFYIVNNAGSFIDKHGAGDRDIGNRLEYQYDRTEKVDAFCGVCVMLWRSITLKRELFGKHFFAYYEDSELSWWIRTQLGAEILFEPNARVYHRHSETMVENSPIWKLLVSRSSLYFRYTILQNQKLGRQLLANSLETVYSETTKDVPDALLDTLKRLDNGYFNEIYMPQRLLVGIYNAHLKSMGGGEAHCLALAAMISKYDICDVYIISENDFDVKSAMSYFGIKSNRIKHLRISTIETWHTRLFDIFINSSFGSCLLSDALLNYYIVSFPSSEMISVVKRYSFLHNSKYTESWASKFWGDHNSNILLPIIALEAQSIDRSKHQKKFQILNLGRFNSVGHCKNQGQVIEAFIMAKKEGSMSNKWTLAIAGSVDLKCESSLSYYEHCKKLCAERDDVMLFPSASREQISNLLLQSCIYVHAAGLGKDPETEPHLHEHFGISVFEAILHGCDPLVYSVGGPKEIIRSSINASDDSFFSTFEELISMVIRKTIRAEEALNMESDNRFRSISDGAAKFLEQSQKDAGELVAKIVGLALHLKSQGKV